MCVFLWGSDPKRKELYSCVQRYLIFKTIQTDRCKMPLPDVVDPLLTVRWGVLRAFVGRLPYQGNLPDAPEVVSNGIFLWRSNQGPGTGSV